MGGMPPIVWHEAEGFLVRDPYGNQWIDLTSGIVMANAGHGHPRIVEAIQEVTEQKLLASYAFPTEVRTRLLEKLVALSPFDDARAILFSSGTEGTECAMALMRLHGKSISPKKVGVLSFLDGYHGRTLAASLAAGRPEPKDWIRREAVLHYQVPYPFCVRCPWERGEYNNCGGPCFDACMADLEKRGIASQEIGGVIIEAAAGWSTWPIPSDFGRRLEAWARENRILLTIDEVQSGCGRTGKFFAFEHVGIKPDLIVMGKGLTSSLPASAVIGPQPIMDLPEPGEMSSTHGGNPVCAAAALANLEVIEQENLVAGAAQMGAKVIDRLQGLKQEYPDHVRSIHGRGLFISIHLQDPETGEPHVTLADSVVAGAVRRGVLMFPTGRGFLKFTPPLCIEPEAALEAVDVIYDSFAECVR